MRLTGSSTGAAVSSAVVRVVELPEPEVPEVAEVLVVEVAAVSETEVAGVSSFSELLSPLSCFPQLLNIRMMRKNGRIRKKKTRSQRICLRFLRGV